MKYFIAGTEVHSDKDLQSGPLENYYELGHECVYTHLLAKRFIKNGILNPKEDIVVTCEGREFFYDNYIKTITWKQFEEVKKHQLTTSINAVEYMLHNMFQETQVFHDLFIEDGKTLEQIYNHNLPHEQNLEIYIKNGKPKYKYHDEDYDMITNLNLNKELAIHDEKYICVNRRFRKHFEEINMPEDYTHELLKELKNTFKMKIFITGYHNETFESIDGVKWVSLKDWCTLINNDKCHFIVQNQTGTANLSQLCGKEKLLNIVLDMQMVHFNMPLYKGGRRPDILGKATNFKKLRNVVFKQTPSINEIIDTVKKYA
jgi:hypothetical protein